MPARMTSHAARLRGCDNLVEIGPQLFNRQAAQRVVAAELDQQVGRLVGQHPVEPGETAGRGVAGDAGVEHRAAATPRCRSACLEPDRERLRARPRRSRRPANRRAPLSRHAQAVRRIAGHGEHGRPAAPTPCGASGSGPSPRWSATHRRPGNPALGDDRARRRASYPSERRGAGGDPARHRPRGRGRHQRKRGGSLGLRQVQPDVDHRRDRAADRRPGGGRRRRSRRRSTRTGWPCSAATGSASCSSPSI